VKFRWELAVGIVGIAALLFGHGMGLFYAPPERMMGEVGRIFYVHVPVAWYAMLTFTVAAVAAVGWLTTGRHGFDWCVEAATEVGIVLNALLLILGSLWARPTWGVWWTWDPRLTSATVMLLTFVGVMLLRSAFKDPLRRANRTAIATILAFVNVPVTYMSVKWWRSLHQIQSTPDTVSEPMVLVFRINLVAMLLVVVWFIAHRWRIAKTRAAAERPPELPPRIAETS